MKAVKGNKEYTISAAETKSFQERGFDIKDDQGKVIAYGKGKTVSLAEHEAVKRELEAAKEELEALKAEKEPKKKEPKKDGE